MINSTQKRPYVRPSSATNYSTFGNVFVGEDGYQTATWPLKTLAGSRIQDYEFYSESDTIQSGAAEVFTSGSLHLDPAGLRVGVLKYDEQPGRDALFAIEGRFWLPIAYLSGDTSTISTTDAESLKGKIAYYISDTGRITDTVAAGDSSTNLAIGYFDGEVDIKRNQATSGIWKAIVRLDPSLMISNTAVSAPADLAKSNSSNTYDIGVAISDFVGLNQELSVTAAHVDPNLPLVDENVTWTVEGTVIGTGLTIPATFTAGTGKTIAVSVVFGTNAAITQNYTVTIAADAAPASLASV